MGRSISPTSTHLIEPLREPSESPEQAVLRSEHRAYLQEGLQVLTVRERTALLLRDVEGLSADEVARQLCCSKATVRSHIANARIKFKRYVERTRRVTERRTREGATRGLDSRGIGQ